MAHQNPNVPKKTQSFPPNEEEQKLAQNPPSKATNESRNDRTESQSPAPYPEPRRSGSEEALLFSKSCTGPDEEGPVQDFRRKLSSDVEGSLEVNGRERLKRHGVEMAGRVWIPDMWGQEEMLKDWVDCTALDASLVQKNIFSARAALVEEGKDRE